MISHTRIAAVAASGGLRIPKRDPLRFRRMASIVQRKVCEWIAQGIDTYWHAGNGSGKTDGLTHVFVAMCRGLTEIDGRVMTRPGEKVDPADLEPYTIKLPGLVKGEAWRHWVLVNSYDQAKDSSMRSYRLMLGKHPHKIGWLDKGRGIVKTIRVKPDGWDNDEPSTWSEITFISQENMTEDDVKHVQGARVNSVHGDEMPKENVWREIRARRSANQMLHLGIGATPEFKKEWEWCLNDYLGCYDNVVRGRVRIQSSVRDNRALSLVDLDKRIESYEGDSLIEARINGDHVDIAGGCPFDNFAMDRMLATCQPGRTERIELRGAGEQEDFRDFLPSFAYIERWLPVEDGHVYLLTADTSRGIDDGRHDPCEMQIWDWTEPGLALRFGMKKGEGGFLDEDSLAILSNKLGREYNNALADAEVAGNFGVQFFLTLRKLRYPNLSRNDSSVRPGQVAQEYGWTPTPGSNGEIVAALQKGLLDDSFGCWSRDAVSQWKDVRESADGKSTITKRSVRHHREAMICAGRALHVIQTKPCPRPRRKKNGHLIEEALRKSFGRSVSVPSSERRQRGSLEVFRKETP